MICQFAAVRERSRAGLNSISSLGRIKTTPLGDLVGLATDCRSIYRSWVHLWRNANASVVVLDEPDVFLHADLQRRLVRLLEKQPYQTITATHSVEMLAEATEDSIVWVDKSRKRAISRPFGVQDLSGQIGSHFNSVAQPALKAKTVLFVEGKDMTLLRHIANTIGAAQVSDGSQACCHTVTGLHKLGTRGTLSLVHSKSSLGESMSPFVILDRDYRADSGGQGGCNEADGHRRDRSRMETKGT